MGKKGIFSITIMFLVINTLLVASEKKIGLCMMATGKYDVFASRLIESAKTFFLKDYEVTYFVFTDGKIEEADDVKVIYQKRLGWPYDTLMRFEVYLDNMDLLDNCDYLFAIDADMLFVADVGEEILGDLVGTIHHGYYNRRGTYETRKKSTACVRTREGSHYFAGAFYGGKKWNFFKLLSVTSANIRKDLSHGFIALWHDESYLNRYFIDYPPTIRLDPSYCYHEDLNIPFPKKIIDLNKNCEEMRK